MTNLKLSARCIHCDTDTAKFAAPNLLDFYRNTEDIGTQESSFKTFCFILQLTRIHYQSENDKIEIHGNPMKSLQDQWVLL